MSALPSSFGKNKPQKKIRVASIHFGFDNQKMIKMLDKRGTAVMAGKADKAC